MFVLRHFALILGVSFSFSIASPLPHEEEKDEENYVSLGAIKTSFLGTFCPSTLHELISHLEPGTRCKLKLTNRYAERILNLAPVSASYEEIWSQPGGTEKLCRTLNGLTWLLGLDSKTLECFQHSLEGLDKEGDLYQKIKSGRGLLRQRIVHTLDTLYDPSIKESFWMNLWSEEILIQGTKDSGLQQLADHLPKLLTLRHATLHPLYQLLMNEGDFLHDALELGTELDWRTKTFERRALLARRLASIIPTLLESSQEMLDYLTNMDQNLTTHRVLSRFQKLNAKEDCRIEKNKVKHLARANSFFIDNPTYFPPGPIKEVLLKDCDSAASRITKITSPLHHKTLAAIAYNSPEKAGKVLKILGFHAYDNGYYEDAVHWFSVHLKYNRIAFTIPSVASTETAQMTTEDPESLWGLARGLYMLHVQTNNRDSSYLDASFRSLRRALNLLGIMGIHYKHEVRNLHKHSVPVGYQNALKRGHLSLELWASEQLNTPAIEGFFMFAHTDYQERAYLLMLREIIYQRAEFYPPQTKKERNDLKKTKSTTDVIEYYAHQTDALADSMPNHQAWEDWHFAREALSGALAKEGSKDKMFARYALSRLYAEKAKQPVLKRVWQERLTQTLADLRGYSALKRLQEIVSKAEENQENEEMIYFLNDILTLKTQNNAHNQKLIIHKKVRGFCEKTLLNLKK
ncbi:MAG: hypothetical protein ACK5O7_06900 [Holosporales bacterium]